LLVILVLIVLLPLVILGWLGVRVAQNEREMMGHRFRDVVTDRLRDVDGDIAEVLMQRERELLSGPAPSTYAVDRLRELTRRSATVRQYFVLDDEGGLAYPVPREAAQQRLSQTAQGKRPAPFDLPTEDEIAFLERTEHIWANGAIPNATDEAASDAPIPAPRRTPAAQIPGKGVVQSQATAQSRLQQVPRPATTAKGWYAWYWDDDVRLIFWWRDASGRVVGAELNEVRLKADIVGALPDTDPWEAVGSEARYVLRDSGGGAVYQWGVYEPGEEEPAQAGIALSPPLSAWRLECYGPDPLAAAGFGRSAWFNVLSGLGLLAATVVALAIYYYRESSRDLREAAQRISFVNQVSHELKTPLTNIRMYAEMLDQEIEEADEAPRRRLGVIVSESQRLSRLIGNVLTFSRKQRSALKLHPARGNVDEVVGQVVAHFEAPLGAKGVEVRFVPGARLDAELDREVLEQITGNLLSNVEKYATSATCAEVTTAQEAGRVSVTVYDDGPGVPPAERGRIFQPFYRVSNKLTDGVAGTGIGLAIARDLAQLHGGDLALESTERGACFKLVLQAPLVDSGNTA